MSLRRVHPGRLGEVALTQPAQQPYYEEPCALPFNVTLTSGQEKLNQGILTDGDGDFVLLGLAGTQTGAYSIRFRLPSGRYWPSAYCLNANVIGTAQFPVPIEPGLVYRAGEMISVDVKDESAASNTVQIVFIGKKLLRVR